MITLYGKALTSNNAYNQTRQGRRFLKPEAKQYKLRLAELALEAFPEMIEYQGWVEVKIIISGDWMTKDGRIAMNRGDADGFVKLAQDAVLEAIGIDDSSVRRVIAEKVDGPWSISVDVTPLAP